MDDNKREATLMLCRVAALWAQTQGKSNCMRGVVLNCKAITRAVNEADAPGSTGLDYGAICVAIAEIREGLQCCNNEGSGEIARRFDALYARFAD